MFEGFKFGRGRVETQYPEVLHDWNFELIFELEFTLNPILSIDNKFLPLRVLL